MKQQNKGDVKKCFFPLSTHFKDIYPCLKDTVQTARDNFEECTEHRCGENQGRPYLVQQQKQYQIISYFTHVLTSLPQHTAAKLLKYRGLLASKCWTSKE